jgi:DNA/RNA-binding domain of Phe-tRNA-synthetase-like protein
MTFIDPEIAAEFPALRLHELTLAARSGPSPPELRERLRLLSDRFRGPQAIALRQQPIPHAYRVFFRHLGLDPDEHRTPVEALALERLKHGGFLSRSTLDDALTIAIMETGVPVWALDADRVEGELGLRLARRGEDVPAGRIVVADDAGPTGVLFGALAPGRGVSPETTHMTLLALQVAGVPDIYVEEALWTMSDILGGEA